MQNEWIILFTQTRIHNHQKKKQYYFARWFNSSPRCFKIVRCFSTLCWYIRRFIAGRFKSSISCCFTEIKTQLRTKSNRIIIGPKPCSHATEKQLQQLITYIWFNWLHSWIVIVTSHVSSDFRKPQFRRAANQNLRRPFGCSFRICRDIYASTTPP